MSKSWVISNFIGTPSCGATGHLEHLGTHLLSLRGVVAVSQGQPQRTLLNGGWPKLCLPLNPAIFSSIVQNKKSGDIMINIYH